MMLVLLSIIRVIIACLFAVDAPAAPSALAAPIENTVSIQDADPIDERLQDDSSSGVETSASVEPAVDELLDRLEADAAHLDDFTANIRYDAFEPVMETTEVSIGRIVYDIDRTDDVSGRKRFAVLFSKRGTPEKLRDRSEQFIFDGEWLVEKIVEEKQFIKRQIVPPGETFDPLKLGEGPFPLPLGQKKADVLARFEVEDAVLPEDGLLSKLLKNDQVHGLKLVPKPNTSEAEDYEKVLVFYDRATLLPVGVDAFGTSGKRDTVWLGAVERNTGIDPALLDTSTPSDPGWRIDIRRWEERDDRAD